MFLQDREALRPALLYLVDSVLEALASLELGLGRCLDLHGLASARIAAGRCLALCNRERAEADEANFVTLLQRSGDRIENTFDGLGRITAGKATGICNCADEIILIHYGNPLPKQ